MYLNPRLLKVFQAAMRTGSATAAALEVRITQPAVSRALKELEQALGFSLFQRSRYGLTPTPEARLLAVEVERAQSALDQVGETARMIRDNEQGQLRIAALPVYADGFVSRMVADFVDGSPGIAVRLVAANLNEVDALVGSHQADIGVTARDEVGGGLQVHASVRRSAICIFPVGDPLESCCEIAAVDLQDRRMVQLTEGSSLRVLAERQGLFRSNHPSAPIEVGTQSAMVSLVAAGIGVGIVDPEVVPDAMASKISMRPLRPPILWSIVLITREGLAISRVAKRFISWSDDRIDKYLRRIEGG